MIDFQSDSSKYGRGEQHLSATLQEDDVVVYRTGCWYVDNVLVGEEPASYHYARVDSLQVVWTHNCEHGVLRGIPLKLTQDRVLEVIKDADVVEWGPEQLVARIPVQWMDENSSVALVPLSDDVWKQRSELF